jgi:hypothetical protein
VIAVARRLRRIPSGWVLLVMAAACSAGSSGAGGTSGTPGIASSPNPHAGHAASPAASAARPSSPATIRIVKPRAGEVLGSRRVAIEIELVGARIASATSTTVAPREGHVHLFVDNSLASMNYGLKHEIDLPRGAHVVRAEFVAADHVPFSPRVFSPEVVVTVR